MCVDIPSENDDKEIERYSDRKRKTHSKREALASYLILTPANFPVELVQGNLDFFFLYFCTYKIYLLCCCSRILSWHFVSFQVLSEDSQAVRSCVGIEAQVCFIKNDVPFASVMNFSKLHCLRGCTILLSCLLAAIKSELSMLLLHVVHPYMCRSLLGSDLF